MTIDLYSSTGEKKGSLELPATLFESKVNEGLMHLMLTMQQGNRRKAIAHVKTRGEVRGSTRKLFQQKGTGRARRGPIRSPLLRGGGKAFGPRKERNFTKGMPKNMRRAALLSCLSFVALKKRILALEGYGEDHPTSPAGLPARPAGGRGAGKTKTFVALLRKLPVTKGRRILIVIPKHMEGLERGARNVPGVKTLLAPYLNPEDLLSAHHVIFLMEALKVAEKTFGEGQKGQRGQKGQKKATSVPSETSAPSSTL